MSSVEMEEFLYPSQEFIAQIEQIFLEVVTDDIPMPSIETVPDDTAVEAVWYGGKVICTFYDGIESDDPEERLNPHYSFRAYSGRMVQTHQEKGDINDPNFMTTFRQFLTTHLV